MLFNRSTIKTARTNSSKRRNVYLVVLILVVGILCTILWLATGILKAKNSIITDNQGGGSVLLKKNANDVKATELKGEGDGRINILLLGKGGDNHPGGQLTDTMIVVSIDTENNKVAMLSVPRDMWVKIPGYGYNKINYANFYGEQKKTGNGPVIAKQTVSDLLDLPIHYYVSVDFSAVTKLVDAVGGISITVEKAIDDPFYPAADMIHYAPVHIKAGTQTMNGELALKYARSRETTSDFDRSRRQMQVISAIKDKALSAGVLANPLKINEIISIIGAHLRTDMQAGEIQQLITMLKSINTTSAINKVLDTAADSPLKGVTDERGYVIVPKDGDMTYQEVKRIAHEIFTDPYLAKENATIEIQNATGKTGTGVTVSALLKSYGYDIAKVTTKPTELYTQLIDYTGGKKPFTQAFLEKRYSVKAIQATPTSATTTNFVLVLGTDYGQGTKN